MKLDVFVIVYIVITGVFMLVALHGWPSGDWGLGWTALAAIATSAATITALWLARVQLRQIQEQKAKENEVNVKRAILAASMLDEIFRGIVNEIINVSKLLQDESSLVKPASEIIEKAQIHFEAFDFFSREDLDMLWYVNPRMATDLANLRAFLDHLKFTFLIEIPKSGVSYKNYLASYKGGLEPVYACLDEAKNKLSEARRVLDKYKTETYPTLDGKN